MLGVLLGNRSIGEFSVGKTPGSKVGGRGGVVHLPPSRADAPLRRSPQKKKLVLIMDEVRAVARRAAQGGSDVRGVFSGGRHRRQFRPRWPRGAGEVAQEHAGAYPTQHRDVVGMLAPV
jgi:hypothetical protein